MIERYDGTPVVGWFALSETPFDLSIAQTTVIDEVSWLEYLFLAAF